jgi:hypothetical protein
MVVLPTSNPDTDRLTQLAQAIRRLQQVQRGLPNSTTMADIADLLAGDAATYGGAEMLLEDTIQKLVGEHLTLQLEMRSADRRTKLAA